MSETAVFVAAALIVLAGAGGVILARNPVHAALGLVASLFGMAVLFVAQEAHLLAAVQVIVYTGAIVVLILFVMMLLGVDKEEDIGIEPLPGQRPVAVLVAFVGFAGLVAVLLLPQLTADERPGRTDPITGESLGAGRPTFEETVLTGERGATAPIDPEESNVQQVGRAIFTDYVFAFEVTALLLTIAVVGAVVLSRRVSEQQSDPGPEAAVASGEGG